jgi:hypothetical protein
LLCTVVQGLWDIADCGCSVLRGLHGQCLF